MTYHRRMHDETKPVAMTEEQLRDLAVRVAGEMKAAAGSTDAVSASGGGSRHRNLPEDVRSRFIDVRTALFQRGIFDPVLVRFDTATGTQAATAEVGDQLARIAEGLPLPGPGAVTEI